MISQQRMKRSVSDQSNNPTSFIQEILKAESMSATATMSWTLFNGYGIKANKEKLNQIEQLSNGNLTLTIENTTQGILSILLQLYHSERKVENSYKK